MTIQSLIVCNSSSKLIFARQFIPITRKEIEEHAVAFHRSLNIDKESTVIEVDNNRFLYIKAEDAYIILITSKDSNIIEDMEVLKLSHRFISDTCQGKVNDTNIIQNAFTIALGLDDILSHGMFDGVNLSLIKQFLTMDSADEKEYKKLQLQKEKAAQEQLNIRMRELERERQNRTFNSDAIGSDTITLGSSILSSNNQGSSTNITTVNEEQKEEDTKSKKDKVKGGKVSKVKGMTLGGKKKIVKETKEDEENDN